MNLPVFPSHPDCERCDLGHIARSTANAGIPTLTLGLPPDPHSPAVVFIGMNPGYFETQQNEPFVSTTTKFGMSAGKILREAIIAPMGLLDEATVYLTNVARCGPDPIAKARHYKACAIWLADDLRSIAAMHSDANILIVLLGADAVTAFHKEILGINGVNLKKSMAHQAQQVEWGSTVFTIFTTFHPAYVNRENKMIYAVQDHMALISDFLDGTLPVPSEPTFIEPRSPITGTHS